MQNRLFFSQDLLDQWIVAGRADLVDGELRFSPELRSYRLVEALRIDEEVAGAPDVHELVGRVKSRRFLEELGGEVLDRSLILGDAAYDVTPGWIAKPTQPFDEFVAQYGQEAFGLAVPPTEEELLHRVARGPR